MVAMFTFAAAVKKNTNQSQIILKIELTNQKHTFDCHEDINNNIADKPQRLYAIAVQVLKFRLIKFKFRFGILKHFT